MALEVAAFNIDNEDYGTYVVLALPMGETSLETLTAEMSNEVEKIQTELISEKRLPKNFKINLNLILSILILALKGLPIHLQNTTRFTVIPI